MAAWAVPCASAVLFLSFDLLFPKLDRAGDLTSVTRAVRRCTERTPVPCFWAIAGSIVSVCGRKRVFNVV